MGLASTGTKDVDEVATTDEDEIGMTDVDEVVTKDEFVTRRQVSEAHCNVDWSGTQLNQIPWC